jgi:CTP:molybdopterin cytidylyltransferase MocA
MPSETDQRMPHFPLVLLAAGLGTRFGGIKPLAKVGANDESILAVTISQARQAGFDSVIVVVSERTLQPIEETLQHESVLPFRLVRQDLVGPPRAKPWGTVAAILAAATLAQNFVVANGDDIYGIEALHTANQALTHGSEEDAVAVLFRLHNTHPGVEGVSRAIAEIDAANRLRKLTEHRNVRPKSGSPSGALSFTSDQSTTIAAEAPTSMNLWVIRQKAVGALAIAFEEFVDPTRQSAGVTKGESREIGLPQTIGALNSSDAICVGTTIVSSETFGVTFAGDVETVRRALTTSPLHTSPLHISAIVVETEPPSGQTRTDL